MADQPAQQPTQQPGCVAAIFTSHGQVILQLRDQRPDICWPGYWSLLGGSIEPGETPAQAIRREVAEEAGITPSGIEQITVTPYEVGKTPPHVFTGQWDGTEDELVLGEGQALRLIDADALPEQMPPHIRHYLQQIIERQP